MSSNRSQGKCYTSFAIILIRFPMSIKRFLASGTMVLSLLAGSVSPLAALARESDSDTRTVDAVCVKTAVGVREDAIMSALNTFNASLTAAHTARKTALQAAWDETERSDRRSAMRAARKTFKTSAREARNAMREARKSAFDTFKTSAKACGYNTSSDDGSAREDQGSSV